MPPSDEPGTDNKPPPKLSLLIISQGRKIAEDLHRMTLEEGRTFTLDRVYVTQLQVILSGLVGISEAHEDLIVKHQEVKLQLDQARGEA